MSFLALAIYGIHTRNETGCGDVETAPSERNYPAQPPSLWRRHEQRGKTGNDTIVSIFAWNAGRTEAFGPC